MSDRAAPGSGGFDQPREHSFDGIEEYDNDLPRWWLAMLYASVAVALVYVLHFHFGPGLVGPQSLASVIATVDRGRPKAGGPYTEDQLRAFSTDAARAAVGKKITTGKGLCFTCHTMPGSPELTGMVGPNLRDEYWIYGSNMVDIVQTITKGHIERGMPPQEKNLTKDEIADVACYIVQLNRQGLVTNKSKPIDRNREKSAPITY